MPNFREWAGDPQELATWVHTLKAKALASIKAYDGYISVAITSVAPITIAQPAPPNTAPALALAAHTEHPGEPVHEATPPGWKGPAATQAAQQLGLTWPAKDQALFAKAMTGAHSLPQRLGREMGLLFEVEVFSHLVAAHRLAPVNKDASWITAERARLEAAITARTGVTVGRMVPEFIRTHAQDMANQIYAKAVQLVKCPVDSVEFTGGDGSYAAHLKADTADIRVGCKTFLPGVRAAVGFSLKAVTETQVQVRSFSPVRTLAVLGAAKRDRRDLLAQLNNPLFDPGELKDALLGKIKAAADTFAGNPRKFAALLDLLVTGGADTIPAYRSLLRPDTGPGWAPAVRRDFATREGPGRKLAAKPGASITVAQTNTYVKITYLVPGGNHYGTSVVFEPAADKVYVTINNLTSKGGRGY